MSAGLQKGGSSVEECVHVIFLRCSCGSIGTHRFHANGSAYWPVQEKQIMQNKLMSMHDPFITLLSQATRQHQYLTDDVRRISSLIVAQGPKTRSGEAGILHREQSPRWWGGASHLHSDEL